MAYRMRRGKKPPFKMMGSSPYKEEESKGAEPVKMDMEPAGAPEVIEAPEPPESEPVEIEPAEKADPVDTNIESNKKEVEIESNPEEVIEEKEIEEAPIENEIDQLSSREIRDAYDEGNLATVQIDPETGEESYTMTRDLPEVSLVDQHISEANRFKAEQDSIRKDNPIIDNIHGNTEEAADVILEAASWHPALAMGKIWKPLKYADKLKKGKKIKGLFGRKNKKK